MVASATLRPRTSNPYAAFRRRAFCVSVNRGMRHDGITVCDADQERRCRDRGEFPDRRQSYLLRSGSEHAPLGRPFRWAVQTSLLEDAGFQPFVDHPSDNAVRDSSVEEVPEMAMVNRVEIFLDINIDTPSYSLTHEGCSESIQRLMGRAAWSEAIRAGEEILLVYCLQYHGTLCHFVFECRGMSGYPEAVACHPLSEYRPGAPVGRGNGPT